LAWLYIRYYSIGESKKLISYFKGKQGKKPINILDIIEKIKSSISKIDRYIYIPLEDFVVDEVKIDIFDFRNPIQSFIIDSKVEEYTENMDSLIPAWVYRRIREIINETLVDFNNLNLFELTQRDESKVRLDLFNDESHIYTVLRVMLRDDLASLYRNLYDLKTKLNIGFNELKHITYSEYEIYITQYNEEQKSLESEMENNSKEYAP
jgi:hypothetical protein